MIVYDALIKDLTNCLAGASNLITSGQFQNADNLSLDLLGPTVRVKRKLLVAFSGGPDSTALLLALQAIAPSFDFAIQACHINHNLRGHEADADADFCKRICRQLDIKCKVIRLPLPGTGQCNEPPRTHFSEDNLRQMRYQHLQSFAHEQEISLILTGHTLDDQSETILFNLFRGTALTGLTGMKTCRHLDNKVYLLRPLLNVTKEQCAQFVQCNGIEPCHDSSNLNEIYSRNYIRHNIIPTIHRRFPGFAQHIHSMRQILASEDQLLADLAQQLLHRLESVDTNCWSLELIAREPLALQRRAIACALQKRDIVVSFARIEEILALTESDNALNLNENWYVRCRQSKLLWQRISIPSDNYEKNNFRPIAISIPGINRVLPLGIALCIEPYINGDRNDTGPDQDLQDLVDLSNIKPPLMLRSRQPGDLIKPLGMTQPVKLKKYLHTHKKVKAASIYAHTNIVLADQEEIVWLPGGGLSEKIKVTASPSHSLRWLKLQDSPSITF